MLLKLNLVLSHVLIRTYSKHILISSLCEGLIRVVNWRWLPTVKSLPQRHLHEILLRAPRYVIWFRNSLLPSWQATEHSIVEWFIAQNKLIDVWVIEFVLDYLSDMVPLIIFCSCFQPGLRFIRRLVLNLGFNCILHSLIILIVSK